MILDFLHVSFSVVRPLARILILKNECNKNIEARLESARRTKYALMGSGFHGTNGIDDVTPTEYITHTVSVPIYISPS
jgi:hypothetical protein